jgi:hypothetical protein
MLPAEETEPKGRTLRRLGPLIVILVIVAGVVAALALSGGNKSDSASASSTTTAPSGNSGSGAVTFDQAKAQGLDVKWPATCDTKTGRVAIPSNFAAECVVPWKGGDNGGATSTGVTSDTIKIVYYVSPPDPFVDTILNVIKVDDTEQQIEQTLQGFVDLYQKYYETYGRKVEVIPFHGTATSTDEVAARADAVTIAEKYKPFMVWGGPFLTDAFSNELAARHIIDVSIGGALASRYYIKHSPYLWTVLMTPDQLQVHLAEYMGKRLAGKPAEFAGDAAMKKKKRVFGRIYLEVGPDVPYLKKQFDQEMAKYGAKFAVSVPYTDPVTLPTVVSEKVAALKKAGVTTVVCVCDPLAPATFTKEATAQNWFPEWVISGSNAIDSTVFARTYDQKQWAHAFGPSSLWARGKPEATFAYYLYTWFEGTPPPADNFVPVLFAYPSALFWGIQGAGPNLTPQTFHDALFAGKPVPAGLTNPAVSYGRHGLWKLDDYAAIDDMTEIWWDPKATGPDERGKDGTGMYQYVDGGKRYSPGHWPSTTPNVFDPKGAVDLYVTLPPSDKAGDYPQPKN